MTAHLLLNTAMPRLLAASGGTAVLTAVLIRLLFRRRRSYLDVRVPKSPTGRDAGL